MQTIEAYCSGISTKTLLTFCNDCTHAPTVIENPNFVVLTAFANLMSPDRGFDTNWLKYVTEEEKIEQIIVVGHCRCKIIEYLTNETTYSNSSTNWTKPKFWLDNLQNFFGKYSNLEPDAKINFLSHYISFQVHMLHELVGNIDSEYFMPICVKGILIDDENHNVVHEIKDPVFSLATATVN